MSSTKVKSSSKLLNVLIILVGLLFIFQALIYFLTLLGVIVPTGWLADLVGTVAGAAALGGETIVSAVLGLWCIVAGVGMFKDAEWAMGQALVVLSIMVATTIYTVISWIFELDAFFANIWTNIVIFASFLIGLIGFIWLLATRKRFH